MGVKLGLVVVLTATAIVLGPAWAKLPSDTSTSATAGVEEVKSRLAKAFDLARDHNEKAALPLFQSAIAEPAFSQLDAELRHITLYLTGALELERGPRDDALRLAKIATAMDEADGDDWHLLLDAADDADDMDDTVRALATIAQKWPATLSDVSDDAIFRIARDAATLPAGEARQLDLIASLKEAHWTPNDPFSDPSNLWRDLARDFLDRGQVPQAREALALVTDPHIMVSVRIDKTFDPVTRENPGRFDSATVMAAHIDALRNLRSKHPDSLAGVNELARELMSAGRDEEALKILDEAIAHASPADGLRSAYSDVETQLIWTFDARSDALVHLGRFDDAIAEMAKGAKRPERGGLNISQVVNLAGLQSRLGRPKEALAEIADVGPGSAYGKLAIAETKLSAYVQLGEKDKVAQILADARTHVKDAPGLVENMLVEAGDLDGAAALYVQRLNDPTMRDEALLAVQQWLDKGAKMPVADELDRRDTQVQARPDVQAAIKAVGRVETIPFRNR